MSSSMALQLPSHFKKANKIKLEIQAMIMKKKIWKHTKYIKLSGDQPWSISALNWLIASSGTIPISPSSLSLSLFSSTKVGKRNAGDANLGTLSASLGWLSFN